jgi:8-oxo-dGTP pyrophosphatase MutT (NUDIX family)
MERIDSKVVYEGKIATVRINTYRYPDGSTAEREVVEHPGAVAMIAHDDLHIYLVRQPREAVESEALLELPAGKLDVDGESPLE